MYYKNSCRWLCSLCGVLGSECFLGSTHCVFFTCFVLLGLNYSPKWLDQRSLAFRSSALFILFCLIGSQMNLWCARRRDRRLLTLIGRGHNRSVVESRYHMRLRQRRNVLAAATYGGVIVCEPVHPSDLSARFTGSVFNARCVNSHLLSAHTDVCWHLNGSVVSPDWGCAEGAAANVAWRERMARRRARALFTFERYMLWWRSRPSFPLIIVSGRSTPLLSHRSPLLHSLAGKLAVVWFIPSSRR